MKNTFIAKDDIESMIEKENKNNRLEDNKVIEQIRNEATKLSKKSAQSDEKVKVMSEKVEIIDKLIMDTKSCSERQTKLKSALKGVEASNERQKLVNERVEQQSHSFMEEVMTLKGTLVGKDAIHEMISEATKSKKFEESEIFLTTQNQINNLLAKIETIDKLTTDQQQLTEKQIKLKAAFKEVQDFAESQKSINFDAKQRSNLMKADILSLQNATLNKENIFSLIECQIGENRYQENKKFLELKNEIENYKKDLDELRLDTNLQFSENFKDFCTKNSASDMIESVKKDVEQLKKCIDMNKMNEQIKKLEASNMIIEDKWSAFIENNEDQVINISNALNLTLKEDIISLKDNLSKANDQISRYESKLTGNTILSPDQMGSFDGKLKNIETKIKDFEAVTSRLTKCEEKLTKVSSKVNRAHDAVNQCNNQMTKNVGTINQTLNDLNGNFSDLDKKYTDSNCDMNADIEWVKNHVDILRNDLKGKGKDLGDKLMSMRENFTNLKSEIEKVRKHSSEQISSEVKRIESLISSKLNETKADMSQTKISEINQKEVQPLINDVKQEMSNRTKDLDLLKVKVSRLQEALDTLDERLRQQVTELASQKGELS